MSIPYFATTKWRYRTPIMRMQLTHLEISEGIISSRLKEKIFDRKGKKKKKELIKTMIIMKEEERI